MGTTRDYNRFNGRDLDSRAEREGGRSSNNSSSSKKDRVARETREKLYSNFNKKK